MREASPRIPDTGVLQAIQERARQAIDQSPGSTVGKALLVDYQRALFDAASGGADGQRIVNRISQMLHDDCQLDVRSRLPVP
jgi:hypothetical protein